MHSKNPGKVLTEECTQLYANTLSQIHTQLSGLFGPDTANLTLLFIKVLVKRPQVGKSLINTLVKRSR